jgi:uncharacterized protein YjiS (DUF1127 family)
VEVGGKNRRQAHGVGTNRSWFEPASYMIEARRRQAASAASTWRWLWKSGQHLWRQGAKLAKCAVRGSVFEDYGRLRRRRAAIASLSALDDRLLKDIGLLRSEIELAVDGRLPEHEPRAALGRPDWQASPCSRGRGERARMHALPSAFTSTRKRPLARSDHVQGRGPERRASSSELMAGE